MKASENMLKAVSISILIIIATNVYPQWTAGQEITLNVPGFAMIESNHAPVNLILDVTEAGKPVEEVTNDDVFIRMSSRCPGATSREITVALTSGTVPTGTKLTCISAECTTTNSGGVLGDIVTTPVVLSYDAQFLVYHINDSWTGTGYNDGYQITFTWAPDMGTNYTVLQSGVYNMTVVFTLTESNSNY